MGPGMTSLDPPLLLHNQLHQGHDHLHQEQNLLEIFLGIMLPHGLVCLSYEDGFVVSLFVGQCGVAKS